MRTATTKELLNVTTRRLPLSTRFAGFLGAVPLDARFSVLAWGTAGSGKSTFAYLLACELSRSAPCLYATSEEYFLTGTLQTRIKLCSKQSDSTTWLETTRLADVRTALKAGKYKFCFIDSINEFESGEQAVMRLLDEFPRVSFVFIAQATADGKKHLGSNAWRHRVDVVLECRTIAGVRMAYNNKNRFAPSQHEFLIFKQSGQFLTTVE